MRKTTWSVLLAGAMTFGMLSSAHALDTNIKKYVCERLDDFTATITVVSANTRALGKISKDAALAYKFKEIRMSYKEPNKARMEGNADGAQAVFVMNGATQWVSIPKVHIKTKREYGDSPGKRKSLLDVGLVSDYYLTYADAQFVREAEVDGVPCAVFKLTYKNRNEDSSHQLVYIDPRTKVIRRRDAFSQAGKLQAIYFFKDVFEVKPGIWFPRTIEARNTDLEVAGVTSYRDVRVNNNLPDSLFKL